MHAHGLRHTHAAELAGEGLPMNLVQAQLGHASLATTDRYLRHPACRGDATSDLAALSIGPNIGGIATPAGIPTRRLVTC